MFSKTADKTSSMLIFIGAPLVTLFLLISNVTDPVNATKLFVAGGLAFALIAVLIFFNFSAILSQYKLLLVAVCLFVLASVNSTLNSSAPSAQNIYGAYGRNTGFIAYLVLSFIALGALNLREVENFRKIILGLQFAGIVNAIYCAWVLAFGDFIGWSNPYGNILGLFGNPDFISAFLGIFIASLFAFAAAPSATLKYRIMSLGVSALAFYEIVKSHAIQGIVVSLGGIAIVGFFWIRSFFKRAQVTTVYSLTVIILGILGILGTFQKGPLSFVYKTSVSLRGAYWNAGLKMGGDHPFTGVGMDAYGDWYRRARSVKAATVLPGPKTFTNASHNVVIDFFAYGGFPLLLSYLAMIAIAGIAVIRVIRRNQRYDSVFVGMVAAWVCYEVQSVISINQIGLAIWGWLLTGAIVAYESATRNLEATDVSEKNKNKPLRKYSEHNLISTQLVAGIGALVGLLIAVPPLSADMKWRVALKSQNAAKVLSALDPGYFNPSSSQRMAEAVQLFSTNKFPEQAHQIALRAVEFNPDYFDAWKVLYFLPNASQIEKENAIKNMKRLDPLNPDVTAP